MEVSEIRIFLADEERLKAYVTVTFDNCFVVRDLKVINGNTGLFVAMPSKKKKDGTYKDVAHPINSDFRTYLEKRVLEKYQDEYKMVEAGFPIKGATAKDYEAGVDAETVSKTPSGPVINFDINSDFEEGFAPKK